MKPIKNRRRKWAWIICLVTLVLALAIASIPHLGARLILHPIRKPLNASPPPGSREVWFEGNGLKLKGWKVDADGPRKGTVIYLHGVSDNRGGGSGIMERFRKRGFDAIAYDSRAHGESGGKFCTYGFHEKEDLRRVIDTAAPGPIILVGSSLGAAVSLQVAAIDSRVSAVVAAECFSDLRTVVDERAPSFLTRAQVAKALSIAEAKAGFTIDSVSPMNAATHITVPVLLIHGAADTDTPPEHSKRIHSKLAGGKKLLLVPTAKHNQSLSGNVWSEIEQWIDGLPF